MANHYYNIKVPDGDTFSTGLLLAVENAFYEVYTDCFVTDSQNPFNEYLYPSPLVHYDPPPEVLENLGLGTAAGYRIGPFAGSLAFGIHEHIGMLKSNLNLSDLTDAAEARDNLELGNAALLDVGTTTGTVAAGDHSHNAEDISYNPFFTNFAATDVQAAIEALWDLP